MHNHYYIFNMLCFGKQYVFKIVCLTCAIQNRINQDAVFLCLKVISFISFCVRVVTI